MGESVQLTRAQRAKECRTVATDIFIQIDTNLVTTTMQTLKMKINAYTFVLNRRFAEVTRCTSISNRHNKIIT